MFSALFVLVAGVASTVRNDSSIESLLLTDDPLRELNETAKTEFGSDEIILIALDLGHLFDDVARLSKPERRAAA